MYTQFTNDTRLMKHGSFFNITHYTESHWIKVLHKREIRLDDVSNDDYC